MLCDKERKRRLSSEARSDKDPLLLAESDGSEATGSLRVESEKEAADGGRQRGVLIGLIATNAVLDLLEVLLRHQLRRDENLAGVLPLRRLKRHPELRALHLQLRGN